MPLSCGSVPADWPLRPLPPTRNGNFFAKNLGSYHFSMSRPGKDVIEIPTTLLQRLVQTVCYAA
jgi:hypothetical protein